ncbi:MAG: HNH endonuclease [Phycisphaerae bacterium]
MPGKNKVFEDQLVSLSDGKRSYEELASLTGKSRSHVADTVRRLGLPRPSRGSGKPRQPKPENQKRIQQIVDLSDGARSSAEIAEIVGCREKYVQDIARKRHLPRLPRGAQRGAANHGYIGGRRIDLDGYVLIAAPDGHPAARRSGCIYEHRLVAEQQLGRHLQAGEVVDHIDGLTIHNHPDNLRVFASNADHLRATISGSVPKWSLLAREKMSATYPQREAMPRIDSYRSAKERGDVRLRQILLAWLQLGEGSPFLLGTHHWLEQAGIRDLSRSSLELHLLEIDRRYRLAPALSSPA